MILNVLLYHYRYLSLVIPYLSFTQYMSIYFDAGDGSEDGRYFALGQYTGHFRFTDKNNCTMNNNCTGHFLDYPCGWKSFVKQQTYHLKIALNAMGPKLAMATVIQV